MSKKTESDASEAMEAGNVDQIRDIIFGSQMRDYEKRFSRLEERMLSEAETLRNETNSRLDSLESYIKQEVNSLIDQIVTERGEREDDTRHLSNEISKSNVDVDKKVTQLQNKQTQGQSDLHDALLEQSKSLLDEIQSVRNTLTSSLDRSTEELRDDKTDRKALADMFTELGMRLNGDFTLPNSEK